MQAKVLVTYASKYGATAGIAKEIADVIGQAGLSVDVLPVSEVDTLNPYQVVVLGSALYIGRWRKAARKFIDRYEHKLASRDLWIFLSGPTGEEGIDREPWHASRKLQVTLEHVRPRDLVVFHGAIDTEKLSGLETWMINRINAPVGDYRDWQAIRDWANGVAEAIKQGVVQPA